MKFQKIELDKHSAIKKASSQYKAVSSNITYLVVSTTVQKTHHKLYIHVHL
jgi:hypothetical protein